MKNDPGKIEDDLSEMFGQSVNVTKTSSHSLDGIQVVECEMRIDHRSSDNSHSRTRQSAIVLYAEDLDLPEFTLAPQSKGLAKMVFSRLGGLGELSFEDTPEFSVKYFLHAWSEQSARILFSRKVREYFLKHPGWSMRGKGNQLVIFQANVVVEPTNAESFVADSLQILELLQEAETELDARPDIRRTTTADDVLATTGRMGGLVGMMLKNQLRKIGVTKTDVDSFLKDTIPRNVPRGMKRQFLGDTFVLIFVGAILILAGLILGPILFAQLESPINLVGIPIAVFNPLFGGIILFFTLRHRIRKWRVLRKGRLVQGTITGVKRSSTTINNQVRHHVAVLFDDQGKSMSATCNAYGTSVSLANSYKDSGKQVTLLVDPKDPKHVVCTDLLIVFNQGF